MFVDPIVLSYPPEIVRYAQVVSAESFRIRFGFALLPPPEMVFAFDPEPLVYFRSHPGSITIADEGGAVWRGYQLAVNWYRKAATA